jgi:hypothetical protein
MAPIRHLKRLGWESRRYRLQLYTHHWEWIEAEAAKLGWSTTDWLSYHLRRFCGDRMYAQSDERLRQSMEARAVDEHERPSA